MAKARTVRRSKSTKSKAVRRSKSTKSKVQNQFYDVQARRKFTVPWAMIKYRVAKNKRIQLVAKAPSGNKVYRFSTMKVIKAYRVPRLAGKRGSLRSRRGAARTYKGAAAQKMHKGHSMKQHHMDMDMDW
jgi:hypothetical protein